MIRDKIIVWALYDDDNQPYTNYLKNNDKYIVYDIGFKNAKYQIDLSITNKNLIKELSKLPKPNIIIASPPCEAFSIADCNGRLLRNIRINNDGDNIINVRNKYYFNKYNSKVCNSKKRDYYKKWIKLMNGFGTALALLKINEIFKPKYIVVENPKTSLLWHLLQWENDTYLNLAFYNNYDETYSQKPTYFCCNVHLDLLHDNKVKRNVNHMLNGSYSKRSNIPTKLIESIFNQLEKEINND